MCLTTLILYVRDNGNMSGFVQAMTSNLTIKTWSADLLGLIK